MGVRLRASDPGLLDELRCLTTCPHLRRRRRESPETTGHYGKTGCASPGTREYRAPPFM
jgi:hypothetical protein